MVDLLNATGILIGGNGVLPMTGDYGQTDSDDKDRGHYNERGTPGEWKSAVGQREFERLGYRTGIDTGEAGIALIGAYAPELRNPNMCGAHVVAAVAVDAGLLFAGDLPWREEAGESDQCPIGTEKAAPESDEEKRR
jgi:hypothetical protein